MKGFLRTLYGKISLIFLLLILVLGAIQIFVSIRSSVNYVCEASQKLNYAVAENLSNKFEPQLRDTLDISKLRKNINDMTMLNPRVEIYLLDHEGKIISSLDENAQLQRDRVRLLPLMKFLDSSSYEHLPIFGDDPLSSKRRKVFSAAPLPLPDNTTGYVYVILASARYELASDGILNSYILGTSAIALTVTLLFGALIGMILFFFLTKRLHAMTGAVREFENGKYERRIPVKSEDEVGELGLAFNHMADTIERYVRELEKNDTLRRELIANVSHDLRSPLASIQGYLETVLMKDSTLPADQRRKFLEITLNNVVKLNHLVHELFDLSMLDARQAEPEYEPFSLAELIQDVVLKFQPPAERSQIHLMTKLPVNMPMVEGDIGMIERVLSNLIENALRFTPAQGRITISLEHQDSQVIVKVADTGKGIPAADLPHIFDRFYRVEKSRSPDSGGSGLGLAIAKKIVEAHGSVIEVESHLNQGTEFRFSLKTFARRQISQKRLISH